MSDSNERNERNERNGRNQGESGSDRGNSDRGNRRNGGNNANGSGSARNNSRQAPNGSATRKRKKGRKKPKLDPVKYWGDPNALPLRNDYVLECADPTAVIRSLGKAPIPGKNSAPELYFEVLYRRAAGLAQALSFAGGLNTTQADASTTTERDSGSDQNEAAASDPDASSSSGGGGGSEDSDAGSAIDEEPEDSEIGDQVDGESI